MMNDETFSRKGSIRSIIYRSLRIKKKKKVTFEPEEDKRVYLIEEETFAVTVPEHPRVVDDGAKIFGPVPVHPMACELVKYFPIEGRPFDVNCPLTSFERKRRSHQQYANAHHANEQLFCPEQASQIELHFQSMSNSDVVLRVSAPNGECSSLLRPTRNNYVCFNPTKVGCGHGVWVVEVAVRDGCRFRPAYKRNLHLSGQGVMKFHIDPDLRLRQVERLWLGFR